MNAKELKNILIKLDYFIDNNYLELYCNLIVFNWYTPKIKFETQSHHVIPCYYYTLKYGIRRTTSRREMKQFDTDNYRVNLKYKDHILAHYYLCFCTSGKLKKSMCNAFIRMVYTHPNLKVSINQEDVDKLIQELQLSSVDEIYALGRKHTDEWCRNHSKCLKGRPGHPNTKETREKISATLHRKCASGEIIQSEETRKKKSRPGKSNPMYGSTYIWVNDGIKQYRWPKDKDIPANYKLGMLNKKPVACYDFFGNVVAVYDSAEEAGKVYGVSGSMIRKVCLGKNKTAAGLIWKFVV